MAETAKRRGAAHGLAVEVTCHVRRPVRAVGLASWLSRAAPARARGEVSVALVSDARIRALNRTYRGLDYATDVLSFPVADAGPAPGASARVRPATPDPSRPVHRESGPHSKPFLGDIVIAVGVAARQAAAARHPLGTEFRVLALHGLLHLMGFDHERDQGEMAALEARLRLRGGLRKGLIERGKRARTSLPVASAEMENRSDPGTAPATARNGRRS